MKHLKVSHMEAAGHCRSGVVVTRARSNGKVQLLPVPLLRLLLLVAAYSQASRKSATLSTQHAQWPNRVITPSRDALRPIKSCSYKLTLLKSVCKTVNSYI